MTSVRSSLYPRLAGFYFFYYATLGAFVPYWSVYLRAHGFSATAIGDLMAVVLGTRILAPNVWGIIADRLGRRIGIIRIAGLLAPLAFAGVFLGDHWWWLALVLSLYSFFWNAALPQFEATTLAHLGGRTHEYGTIRLWGSVGFILAVAGLGRLLDQGAVERLPVIVLVLLAGIWLASLTVPEAPGLPDDRRAGRLWHALRRPEVLVLLVTGFLVQASHGPYYGFFTLYLQRHGYSGTVAGALWALGVVAEIGVFMVIPRLLPWIGPRRLMLTALALTVVRWLMIAQFVDKMGFLIFAQTLHMASFGVYHAVAIHYVYRFFPGRLQGRGQALYSSLTFGAGVAAGTSAAGYLWDHVAPASAYLGAAGAAALALVIAASALPESPPEAASKE